LQLQLAPRAFSHVASTKRDICSENSIPLAGHKKNVTAGNNVEIVRKVFVRTVEQSSDKKVRG